MKVVAYIVIDRVEHGHNLMKYCDTSIETKVIFDTLSSTFSCACRRFESRGIPCSHIFCAMKERHMDRIPPSLILIRWTKNANSAFMSQIRWMEWIPNGWILRGLGHTVLLVRGFAK